MGKEKIPTEETIQETLSIEEKKSNNSQLMSPIGYIQERLKKIEETLAEHEEKIRQCSIQR